jgi:ATP-dependent DNA helicase RecQ
LNKDDILKNYFGYSRFRPGQAELIDAVLAGRDVLAVMPTGAGKSLCYQIPALLLEGLTLVISPLISLMKDQVSALTEAGVPAAFLNSSLSSGEYADTIFRAAAGEYKILYIAPERLRGGFPAQLTEASGSPGRPGGY